MIESEHFLDMLLVAYIASSLVPFSTMNLLKALTTIGGMTFLSRILGFVRDTLIARIFGAGFMTDAFFVAFKIPICCGVFLLKGHLVKRSCLS